MENKLFDIPKRQLKMEKARIFQLIEILRRVKTVEMGKLKFITNFGVSVNALDIVVNKVFHSDAENIQSQLSTIDNIDMQHLYLYVSFCDEILQNKKINKTKMQLSSWILQDFFDKYPKVFEEFKKTNEYMQESSEDSEDEQKKQNKSKLELE